MLCYLRVWSVGGLLTDVGADGLRAGGLRLRGDRWDGDVVRQLTARAEHEGVHAHAQVLALVVDALPHEHAHPGHFVDGACFRCYRQCCNKRFNRNFRPREFCKNRRGNWVGDSENTWNFSRQSHSDGVSMFWVSLNLFLSAIFDACHTRRVFPCLRYVSWAFSFTRCIQSDGADLYVFFFHSAQWECMSQHKNTAFN